MGASPRLRPTQGAHLLALALLQQRFQRSNCVSLLRHSLLCLLNFSLHILRSSHQTQSMEAAFFWYHYMTKPMIADLQCYCVHS
jgi:hypothetical protein